MHFSFFFCIFAPNFISVTYMSSEKVSVWQPNACGMVEDIENIALDCHDEGKRLVVHMDWLASSILRDPKELGADEVVVEERTPALGELAEEQLRLLAERVHSRATYLNEMVQAYGYEQENAQFFDTIRVRTENECDGFDLQGIELKQDGEYLQIRVLPNVTLEDMNRMIEMLADGVGALAQEEEEDADFDGLWTLDDELCKV